MTISHVLLVDGPEADVVEILSALADVAVDAGATHVHHGRNAAPREFAGSYGLGLTAVLDSAAALGAYLDDPRHHELVRQLEATGGTVVVADIDTSNGRTTDRTDQ